MPSRRPIAVRRPHPAVLAVAVVLAFGMSGCSEEVPEAVGEQALGVDVEIGEDTAPSPPGGGDEGDDVTSLPAALPEELPLPAGMDYVARDTEEQDGVTRVTFEAVLDGDYDSGVLFFDTELPAEGWTITEETELDVDDGRAVRWAIEGFGWTGEIELREDPGPGAAGAESTVSVVLESTG